MMHKLLLAWGLAVGVQGLRLQTQSESFGEQEHSDFDGGESASRVNPQQALVPLLLAFNPSPSQAFTFGHGTSSAVGQRTSIDTMQGTVLGSSRVKPEGSLIVSRGTTPEMNFAATDTQVSRRAALATGAGVLASTLASPVQAYAGDGTMSKEEVRKIAEDKLTPLQQAISLQAATERPFTGKTTNGYSHDNKVKGTYVGAISGAPIFESTAKYDSGTGWPSFFAAVPGGVIERPDPGDLADPVRARLMGGVRTEIIDAKSGAHLGHVFPDGPKPTGLRYCMNAGAMTFIPAEK